MKLQITNLIFYYNDLSKNMQYLYIRYNSFEYLVFILILIQKHFRFKLNKNFLLNQLF